MNLEADYKVIQEKISFFGYDLSETAIKIYTTLLYRFWDDAESSEVAKECGYTETKVRNELEELEMKGFVEKVNDSPLRYIVIPIEEIAERRMKI